MKQILVAMMVFALCFAPCARAADSGVALKDEEIKAEPFRDARIVGKLASGSKVEILQKDGGWMKIRNSKIVGWVRMLSIRGGEAQPVASSTSNLMALSSGRSGKGKIVAGAGVRGLNEEELKAARFDEAAVLQAESYAATAPQAKQFAAQGGLVARPMAYLP